MTVQDYLCWRLKIFEVDNWRLLKLMVWGLLKLMVVQGDMNCENMLTCFQAFMRYATCHFLIGFFIGSKRRFIFRASLIYITYFSFLISTLFSQNILSECYRQPCQSNPSNIHARQLYVRRLSITQSGEYLLLLFFQVLHFVRPTHLSVTIRSVSLRFCRQL